jgi:hypothetical protein
MPPKTYRKPLVAIQKTMTLSDSILNKAIIDRIKGVFDAYKANIWTTKIDFYDYGDDADRFASKIMSLFANIDIGITRLELIELFFTYSELPNFYQSKITARDYFTYHYENYTIKLISIQDYCAKLTNEIFDLKIPDFKCTFYTVKEKEKIKKSEFSIHFENLFLGFESIRKYRNQIVHSGEEIDYKILNNVFYGAFDRNYQIQTDGFDDFIKNRKSEDLEKVTKELTELRDSLIKLMIKCLDSMEPQFLKKYNELKNKK